MSDIEYCELVFVNNTIVTGNYRQVAPGASVVDREDVVFRISTFSEDVRFNDFLFPAKKDAVVMFDLVSKEEMKFQLVTVQGVEGDEKLFYDRMLKKGRNVFLSQSECRISRG